MSTPQIDLSYVKSLSGGDPNYMKEIINIYLQTMTPGLVTLRQVITETDDFHAIDKQAHFLKSSAGIIKVADLHPNLAEIVALARQQTGKERIVELLGMVESEFEAALPLLIEERDNPKN